MKTIGVLGLGAQATVDFEVRVNRAAERALPRAATTGYVPMVVVHHRRPPVVVNEDFSAVLPLRVDPALLEAARWLGGRADFIVMTANGPHRFAKEVEEAAGKPLVSMIDATIAEVKRLGWKRVGALAFQDPQAPVYMGPLRALGLACETIDGERQKRLDAAIMRLMEGRETDQHCAEARAAVETLRMKGVDGVIPGCTEIPLLMGEAAMQSPDMVNPAQLLAAEVVARAVKA